MVHIRAMREDDIEGFLHALDAVARERRFLASTEAPPVEAAREYVRNNLKRGVPHFLALEGSSVVGWIDIALDWKTAFSHKGTLGMGVIQEYRRKGVGTRLMARAIKRAKEIGLEKIELEVFESNTGAIELYRKFGFREEGRKMRGSKIDGRYENNLLMGLFLDT